MEELTFGLASVNVLAEAAVDRFNPIEVNRLALSQYNFGFASLAQLSVRRRYQRRLKRLLCLYVNTIASYSPRTQF